MFFSRFVNPVLLTTLCALVQINYAHPFHNSVPVHSSGLMVTDENLRVAFQEIDELNPLQLLILGTSLDLINNEIIKVDAPKENLVKDYLGSVADLLRIYDDFKSIVLEEEMISNASKVANDFKNVVRGENNTGQN